MDAQLTLSNQSEITADAHIVIFQRNTLSCPSAADPVVAWRVFPVAELTAKRRFHVSKHLSVAAMDVSGHVCEQHLTEDGQHWDVIHSKTRDWMILTGPAAAMDQVEIKNALPRETIVAQIYKDGRLLAVCPSLPPKQTAAFRFENALCIGLTTDAIKEGTTMRTESSLHGITELPLNGLSQAELVLTGRGELSAGAYDFQLVAIPSVVLL